jgi:hypothetical protein
VQLRLEAELPLFVQPLALESVQRRALWGSQQRQPVRLRLRAGLVNEMGREVPMRVDALAQQRSEAAQ